MLNGIGKLSLSTPRLTGAGAAAAKPVAGAAPAAPAQEALAPRMQGDRSSVKAQPLTLGHMPELDWTAIEISLMERKKKTPEEEMKEKLQELKRKIEQAVASGDIALLVKLSGALNVLANTPGISSDCYREARFMMMDLREGFKEALKPLLKKVENAIASGDVATLVKLAGIVSQLAATPGMDADVYKMLRNVLVTIREGFGEALAPLKKKIDQAIASGDVGAMKELAQAISGVANTPGIDASLFKDLRKLLSQVREAIYAQNRIDAIERQRLATKH